jgi:hypothetical protein
VTSIRISRCDERFGALLSVERRRHSAKPPRRPAIPPTAPGARFRSRKGGRDVRTFGRLPRGGGFHRRRAAKDRSTKIEDLFLLRPTLRNSRLNISGNKSQSYGNMHVIGRLAQNTFVNLICVEHVYT